MTSRTNRKYRYSVKPLTHGRFAIYDNKTGRVFDCEDEHEAYAKVQQFIEDDRAYAIQSGAY